MNASPFNLSKKLTDTSTKSRNYNWTVFVVSFTKHATSCKANQLLTNSLHELVIFMLFPSKKVGESETKLKLFGDWYFAGNFQRTFWKQNYLFSCSYCHFFLFLQVKKFGKVQNLCSLGSSKQPNKKSLQKCNFLAANRSWSTTKTFLSTSNSCKVEK